MFCHGGLRETTMLLRSGRRPLKLLALAICTFAGTSEPFSYGVESVVC